MIWEDDTHLVFINEQKTVLFCHLMVLHNHLVQTQA